MTGWLDERKGEAQVILVGREPEMRSAKPSSAYCSRRADLSP
jgi:hypothetical protein